MPLAFVAIAVGIDHDSVAMSFAVTPVALVSVAVAVDHDTVTLLAVFVPLALVPITYGINHGALTVALPTFVEFAVVPTAIRPYVGAAVRLVVGPLAGKDIAIVVDIGALTAGVAVAPLALTSTTRRVRKCTVAVCSIGLALAVVSVARYAAQGADEGAAFRVASGPRIWCRWDRSWCSLRASCPLSSALGA